jgi:poly-gamma-glutamate capsule biosynthesis protein CapA/YwtB (metallophosphatase superfamily)
MRLRDGFSLCAVGDCIISRPISQYAETEPGFAALLDLFAASTAVYGNMETTLIDPGTDTGAPHSWAGDWPLVCDPAAAADLAAMGFDLMARANNHTLDWGAEGMRQTTRLMDAAGLAHAGCGETLGLARRARFRETPLGRIALVSCVSTYRDFTDALDQHDASPGRPGVNPLPVKKHVSVPAAIHESLSAIREQLGGDGLTELLGEYEAGEGAAHYRYEMDAAHLAAILRQVRQGAQFADFTVVALHAHESLTDHAADRPELPAAFIAEFGRAAVEAGADLVVVTGIHHLCPVLVHRGRPILTGLGDFIWSDIQTAVPGELYEQNREKLGERFEHPERATDADLGFLMNHPCFSHEEPFLTVVARVEAGSGGLTAVTLYPVDLGYGEPLTRTGIPRVASPDTARRIFDRLVAISAPYGTQMAVVDDPAFGTLIARVDLG